RDSTAATRHVSYGAGHAEGAVVPERVLDRLRPGEAAQYIDDAIPPVDGHVAYSETGGRSGRYRERERCRHTLHDTRRGGDRDGRRGQHGDDDGAGRLPGGGSRSGRGGRRGGSRGRRADRSGYRGGLIGGQHGGRDAVPVGRGQARRHRSSRRRERYWSADERVAVDVE